MRGKEKTNDRRGWAKRGTGGSSLGPGRVDCSGEGPIQEGPKRCGLIGKRVEIAERPRKGEKVTSGLLPPSEKRGTLG